MKKSSIRNLSRSNNIRHNTTIQYEYDIEKINMGGHKRDKGGHHRQTLQKIPITYYLYAIKKNQCLALQTFQKISNYISFTCNKKIMSNPQKIKYIFAPRSNFRVRY